MIASIFDLEKNRNMLWNQGSQLFHLPHETEFFHKIFIFSTTLVAIDSPAVSSSLRIAEWCTDAAWDTSGLPDWQQELSNPATTSRLVEKTLSSSHIYYMNKLYLRVTQPIGLC